MSSFFPSSLDNFANPVYTKVDGIDVVQASHVNDLQDATRAIQETLITGKTINYNSNYFIADNTSFKLCLETLDDNLGIVDQDFSNHRSFSLVTDPVQHHANVIQVTSIGNLASDRVQLAHLHMNVLNENKNTDYAFVSSLEGESVVIGGDINTALRSVARSDSNSP